MSVNNETESSFSRVTKEGRHLTYEMKVIQQPERARACGSGAKCLSPFSQSLSLFLTMALTNTHAASADRRPVDPPPVVELRIYEGEAKNDVTFAYNANFFLYTTLENARPIAHGRVPNAQNSFPVLTGTPVAGMAYLDRPSPAGYFIFPDLSVRHEGKYRLNFNLYEELKEPNDEDAEVAAGSSEREDAKSQPNNPLAPRSHVHFRLEVKSAPFSVFSAKKFPGLAESTNLSRVVAEQGCRVRIRRDVRMRRRDGPKSKGSYDDYDEEPSYVRSGRFTTPDIYNKPQMPDRPRSISNGSIDAAIPLSAERRPSNETPYYNPAKYQQHPLPAPQPQNANGTYTSHLAFGSSAVPHFPAPTFQPPAPTVSQSSQNYLQSNHGYPYPTTAHSRQISNSQNGGYAQAQTSQQPVYNQNQMYSEPNDYRHVPDYRRSSLPSNHQSYHSQSINSYPQTENRQHMQQNYYQQPQPTSQSTVPRVMTPSNGQALPPILNTLQPPLEKKYEMNSAHPISTTITGSSPEYEAQSKHPMYPQSVNSGSARSTKRLFSSVFDTNHINQPMHSGMRPSSASHGQDPPQIEAEDDDVDEDYGRMHANLLQYKRADGSRQYKKCPSPISE